MLDLPIQQFLISCKLFAINSNGIFIYSLKGYFVEDQFVGETPSASTALTGASIEEDHSSK